jgi:hypothetical protein
MFASILAGRPSGKRWVPRSWAKTWESCSAGRPGHEETLADAPGWPAPAGIARVENSLGKIPSQAPNLNDQHLPLGAGHTQGMFLI